MTTESRLSARTGADILSYISHALGYWPVQSLVCLALTGNTVGATLRLDLPERAASGCWPPAGRTSSGELEAYARDVCGYLEQDTDTNGVLLVVFGSTDWTDPSQRPHRQLVAAVEEALGAAGKVIREAWYVGAGHWRSYRCADATCCGWPGRPVSGITESALNAELIFRGSTYEQGPERLAAVADVPVGQELAELIRVETEFSLCRLAGRQGCEDQFRATLEAWELAVAADPNTGAEEVPDPGTCGFLLASLENVTVRDAVLVLCSVGPQLALEGAAACSPLESSGAIPARPPGWAPTREEAKHLQLVFAAVTECPVQDFGPVLVGDGTSRPDWHRVEQASALLVYLARAGSGETKAAALTMLAWLQWCRGRGTAADCYLELALVAAPRYRLALLLRELLGRGIICGWARNRATAWHPPTSAAA